MTIDYLQLKHEIVQDLSGVGYSGFVAIGDDVDTARLLNQRSGVGSQVIFRSDVTPREIINVVQAADFTGMTQIQLSKLQLLFQGAPVDATLPGLRANFQNIFSGTATLQSGFLSGVATRLGSRAEVLFGVGTSVSTQDVATALRFTSG